jgi:hypothetical protein
MFPSVLSCLRKPTASLLDFLKGTMMETVQFSDVQLINLSMLITMRDSIRQDIVSACCKFGLSADQAQLFSHLSIDQIFVLVANVGQECLFLPRPNLVSLLALPTPLTGPIAAVHPPHKLPLVQKQSLDKRPTLR